MGERTSKRESEQTSVEWLEEEIAAIEREEVEWRRAEAEGGAPIMGIAVHIADRRFRGLLGAVLDRIHARCPADLSRIRSRVRRIGPMQPDEMPPYISAYCGVPERRTLADDRPEIRVTRALVEGSRERLVQVLAHELGHAASTPEDVWVRSGLGGEWGCELAADHLAAKWGFGRLLASQRSGRCVAHHGPVPGEEVVVTFGPYRVAWHVTDDRVPVCDGLVR